MNKNTRLCIFLIVIVMLYVQFALGLRVGTSREARRCKSVHEESAQRADMFASVLLKVLENQHRGFEWTPRDFDSSTTNLTIKVVPRHLGMWRTREQNRKEDGK